MSEKTACNNYQLDMIAAEFGSCKNCGFKKQLHTQTPLSPIKPKNEKQNTNITNNSEHEFKGIKSIGEKTAPLMEEGSIFLNLFSSFD